MTLASGEKLPADEIVVTSPAFAASLFLKGHVDTFALDAINYVSVANVVLAFDKKEFGEEFDGSGFLVPRKVRKALRFVPVWVSTGLRPVIMPRIRLPYFCSTSPNCGKVACRLRCRVSPA